MRKGALGVRGLVAKRPATDDEPEREKEFTEAGEGNVSKERCGWVEVGAEAVDDPADAKERKKNSQEAGDVGRLVN